jgi:hypothetical protein
MNNKSEKNSEFQTKEQELNLQQQEKNKSEPKYEQDLKTIGNNGMTNTYIMEQNATDTSNNKQQ